ncbi:MAG: flagellar basal body rod C-terminal domain-containing protein [Arcobacteraceae bacterium]|nr:flagellar basal body rod C-terminal domain-containing protein [Arcobacteraceae bacterium]
MLNSLNVALSGLSASKTQVENVMNNIANENTVGYKKRVVDVKESEQSDSRITGRGATVIGVDRITNTYMSDNLVKQQSKSAEYDELSTMLADIESILSETDTSGFSNNLDAYFQSIEDLRANPYNEIYRTNLINQGNMLVDGLQSLYSGIEERETISKNAAYDSVDEINSILQDIGKVNQQIQDAVNPSNDLLDKRDLLESRLAQYVEIKVNRADDTYSLEISGVTAVRYNTNIHEISIADNSIAQKDVYATNTNVSTLVAPTWDTSGATPDTLTYYFDKDNSITITVGESITDDYGTFTVDKDSVVRALTYKINSDPTISNSISAYNGPYSTDQNGNKIPQSPTTTDHYLIIESKVAGTDGSFEGRIVVNDNDITDTNGFQVSNLVTKSSIKSVDAQNDIHLEIFGQEIPPQSGKIKSILDNIDTRSVDNKFEKYKTMLDDFAKALSDVTEAYIYQGGTSYVSGEEASLLNKDKASIQTIGLFDGTSVKTLAFNSSVVRNLTQENLDYLSTIHWNENLTIGDSDKTSFSKFYQNIKITVSADKENIDYLKETQDSVTESLQTTYDKLVKVDKDEEMVNLIKFQAAYEANAKLITIVDEMLQTILGMKQ